MYELKWENSAQGIASAFNSQFQGYEEMTLRDTQQFDGNCDCSFCLTGARDGGTTGKKHKSSIVKGA